MPARPRRNNSFQPLSAFNQFPLEVNKVSILLSIKMTIIKKTMIKTKVCIAKLQQLSMSCRDVDSWRLSSVITYKDIISDHSVRSSGRWRTRTDTSRCKVGIATLSTLLEGRRLLVPLAAHFCNFKQEAASPVSVYGDTSGEEIASDTRPKMSVWHPAAGRSCSQRRQEGGRGRGVCGREGGYALTITWAACRASWKLRPPARPSVRPSVQRKWQREREGKTTQNTQKLQLLQQQHVVAVKQKKKERVVTSLQPHELSVTQTWQPPRKYVGHNKQAQSGVTWPPFPPQPWSKDARTESDEAPVKTASVSPSLR